MSVATENMKREVEVNRIISELKEYIRDLFIEAELIEKEKGKEKTKRGEK